MTGHEEEATDRARDYVARFGELALFRIEDEINKAAIGQRPEDLRQWLTVRARALGLLNAQERCLAFGHRPRHTPAH